MLLSVCAGLLFHGCATEGRHQGVVIHPGRSEPTAINRVKGLPPEVRTRILSLNPEQVTEEEVRALLSQVPAPQIINIHGGIFPIKAGMNSFARFLIAMGCPEADIQRPADGSYTYGYYDRSDEIAGAVAWYYERDGLRPILVGHSQGGIQAIRVLHKLAGDPPGKLTVWNPMTRTNENRYEIRDPLTGKLRPVVGLQVSYATVVAAGGLARALPHQWGMNSRLRKIPDSVLEFTGFQKGMDPLGGDYLGYGSANDYYPTGSAQVRNVRLPASSPHWTIPYAKGLLKDPALKNWIANYEPGQLEHGCGLTPAFGRVTAQMLWAAEVWHGIKKHWVLEIQNLIQAQNSVHHDA